MRGILYFLLFLLIVFGIFYGLSGWSYSDGERAGTISKFSRRGFIFKTYEGVLNVGGFSGETGSLTPQYFDFSVKDDEVANKITDAVKTGQRVTLHYEEKIIKFPWNGETKYYITNVEELGPVYPQQNGNQSAYPGNQPMQPPATQPTPAPQEQMPADSVL
ncbi:hypothetical protein [Spirosoma pomorum]